MNRLGFALLTALVIVSHPIASLRAAWRAYVATRAYMAAAKDKGN